MTFDCGFRERAAGGETAGSVIHWLFLLLVVRNRTRRGGLAMSMVVSKDGTEIVYDREGAGAAVVLVDGALGTRSTFTKPELMRLLGHRFTVYNYDRRGRGESGDTGPYAVVREVEDIEALIVAAGGTAFMYGHSSGAALGLEAALALGRKVKALAMYEAPFNDDEAGQQRRKKYVSELEILLADGRREDAVLLFLGHLQIPAPQVEMMRGLPLWDEFKAAAPTLAYDADVLGETGRVPVERAARSSCTGDVWRGELSVYGGDGAEIEQGNAAGAASRTRGADAWGESNGVGTCFGTIFFVARVSATWMNRLSPSRGPASLRGFGRG
ncbi:alpha/beta fold hydrolase [Tunturibacter psychrotolerans]|uniref:Alpha/beta fold hydrolase n=1 Tax=Tunturiibacter psychrotolerans TaxID=3069686 RepID=A0AAU7ZWA3_9BACT